MVPRPPEWSSRAALRVLDEREQRERSRNRRHILDETLGESSQRTERGLSDKEFYAQFRNDHWSPYECTSVFRRTKYALTVGVGKLFARYALLVYRHPWTFIIFPAAVCLLLGVGFLFRKVVTDHEKQFALPESTSHDARHFMRLKNCVLVKCLFKETHVEHWKDTTKGFFEYTYRFPKTYEDSPPTCKDAKRYADAFGDRQVRSEVIYVIAASGTNLLNADFLNALWSFHISVLDLEVTTSLADGDKKSSAGFSVSVDEHLQQDGAASYPSEKSLRRRLLSDHLIGLKSALTTRSSSPRVAVPLHSISTVPTSLFPSSARFSSTGTADLQSSPPLSPCATVFAVASSPSETSLPHSSPLHSASCDLYAPGLSTRADVVRYLANETLAENQWSAKPRELGVAWPQNLGSGRLFVDRLWRSGEIPPVSAGLPHSGGLRLQNLLPFRPFPPAAGVAPPVGPPPLPPPGEVSPPAPPRGDEILPPLPCVEAAAHPKDRISGLACRTPVKSGHYAFSNLCWKDAAGICTPPEGIIFMYNSRGEFGHPLGYPRHTNWVLATEAPTDIWLSQKGLQLTAEGSRARATAGFALRYLLSDDPAQRPAAIEWEHALMRHVQSAGGALPGASLFVKTEQSLAEDLSSSIDPTGHEDLSYVLIAALLIFIYIGFATFSTNRYRSKMFVSLIGGLAAALAYCGGAGLCYLVGLEHTTTVTAAPFLVLGIGVDDVFVIINSYSLTYTRASARERLRITMRDSGLSITVTTLTNLISFAIGSTSPYLAIKNFCVITAAGLFAGYLMCITFFLGCLTIDARYEEKKRLDEVCSCVLPIYRRRRAERQTTENSLGASAAAAVAFRASASPLRVAGDRRQQPPRGRTHGGEEDTPGRNGSTKLLYSTGHKNYASTHTVIEADKKSHLDHLRQSLLNRHANTVYECVTLQVAMALTKGKADRNASSKDGTLRKFWWRVKPSQKQMNCRINESPSHCRDSHIKIYQQQTRVRHSYSKGAVAVADHSGCQFVQPRSCQQRNPESDESRGTYRTNNTAQDARRSCIRNQVHPVVQSRYLTNGSFEGDLVLTHQIPVRTSSTSVPVEKCTNREKRRRSNRSGAYVVRRGRLYNRKDQRQKTHVARNANEQATGCEGAGDFRRTTIASRQREENLAGRLKEGGSRYRPREVRRGEARHDEHCSLAADTYVYAYHQRQKDGYDGAPTVYTHKTSWMVANGAHQLGRRGRRQNEGTLRGTTPSDTYNYGVHDQERSTLELKKKVCLWEEWLTDALNVEGHGLCSALKSHSYDQTAVYHCTEDRAGRSEVREHPTRAGNESHRQSEVMSQLLKKAKKTSYKRHRRRTSVRPAAPARCAVGFVHGRVAQRQGDKHGRMPEKQRVRVHRGALKGGKFQRYTPWQRRCSQRGPECTNVQSKILRLCENQGHSASQISNIVERGNVLEHSKKDLGRRVSALKPEKKTVCNWQRKRRFFADGSADITSPHEEAGGSGCETPKNTGTDSGYWGGVQDKPEHGRGTPREMLDCQKPATRSEEESNNVCQAASQRVTDLSKCEQVDAVTLKGEASKHPRFHSIEVDARKPHNSRKLSLLQRLARRKSNNASRVENDGATQAPLQDKCALSNSSTSRRSRDSPAAPRQSQARRHELLRILTPEDLAEPPGNVGRRWRLLVLHHLGRIVITPVVKLIVLLGFAAIFAVAVIGCTRLKRGLDPRNLSRDGSSLQKFFDAQANYFSTHGDPVNIFFLNPQQPCSLAFKVLADSPTQSEYAWFHNLLESRQYTKLLVDGLDTYWKSPLGRLSPNDNAPACMQMLRSWLQTPIGSNFEWQFTWQNDNELKAFQIQLVPRYYSGSQELSDFMTTLREDLSRFKSASVHAYNKHFIFFESDSNVLASTLSNMAWAVLAVTVVSLILLPSLWSAAMVIFILVLIDVAIVGFMYYWDLPLNMLTMVNLIISIGFSIDYASHMCHTFSHCVGRSRDTRVFETLVLIGNPICHGVMSTQLGVLVLAYTCSYVLRVFFKMMTLVLTLAFAHGAVLLPVLLSLFGPVNPKEEPLSVALRNFRQGLTLKKILSKEHPA